MDPIQIQVLNSLFIALSANKTPKVGDIISRREIASQATIHAALKRLETKKMVRFRTTKDSRAKYVELTMLGKKRFEKLATGQNNNVGLNKK